ncbi:MAG: hypothetical protein JXR66_06565, partial [Bacteroidales bacterium]|nr:hypothetical protein [Bacteroidales bacterium]
MQRDTGTIMLKWLSSAFFVCSMILMSESSAAQGWEANPAVVERLSKARPQFNYYEEKVPEYTLPDVMADSQGEAITKAREWKKIRREEVLELFRENVYGRVPSTPYTQTFKVVNEDPGAMGGAATLKEVDIVIDSDGKKLSIRLTMFVPNGSRKPVPLFLLIDNRGPANTDPT